MKFENSIKDNTEYIECLNNDYCELLKTYIRYLSKGKINTDGKDIEELETIIKRSNTRRKENIFTAGEVFGKFSCTVSFRNCDNTSEILGYCHYRFRKLFGIE